MGMTMGSNLPPFQTTMSSSLGQTGMSPAMDAQKSSGLLGVENKPTSNIRGSGTFNTTDPFSTGGLGIHSGDHPAGIRKRLGFMSQYMEGEMLNNKSRPEVLQQENGSSLMTQDTFSAAEGSLF